MRRKNISDHITETSKNVQKALVFGQVTKVWNKETENIEEGNIEVNVKTVSNTNEMRRVPVTCFDHTGHVSVPQVGDPVAIHFTASDGNTPIAIGLAHDERDEYRSPNAREGHWRHEWDTNDGSKNLYLEAEPADGSAGTPEVVRMGVKPDGLEKASTEVAVDNSGQDTQIRIETDGDITLDADGDILINSSSGAQPVAPYDHTHDAPDGGGQTSGPNEDPTDTQIG